MLRARPADGQGGGVDVPEQLDADLYRGRRRFLLWSMPLAAVVAAGVLAIELVDGSKPVSVAVRGAMVVGLLVQWALLRRRRMRQRTAETTSLVTGGLLGLYDLLGALPGPTDVGVDEWLVAWLSYAVLLVVAPYVVLGRRQARWAAGVMLVAHWLLVLLAATRVAVVGPSLASVVVPLVAIGLAEATTRTTVVMARHGAIARAEAVAGRTDQLTGLANRRGVLPDLEAVRSGDVLLLVDVDRFKRVNDVHGHATGDLVLRRVAGAMTSSVREGDRVARWGGEEFLVVATARGRGRGGEPDGGVVAAVPDALPAAAELAERLRARVAGVEAGPGVTVSVGVAAVLPDDEDWQDALRRADACLYEAKRAGRDRVVVTPGGSGPAAVPG